MLHLLDHSTWCSDRYCEVLHQDGCLLSLKWKTIRSFHHMSFVAPRWCCRDQVCPHTNFNVQPRTNISTLLKDWCSCCPRCRMHVVSQKNHQCRYFNLDFTALKLLRCWLCLFNAIVVDDKFDLKPQSCHTWFALLCRRHMVQIPINIPEV